MTAMVISKEQAKKLTNENLLYAFRFTLEHKHEFEEDVNQSLEIMQKELSNRLNLSARGFPS